MLDRHIGFLDALRDAGLPVSLAEGLDAVRAITAVDLLDRESLRSAYAATVVKRQGHRDVFDSLFDLWYPAATGDPIAVPQPDTEGRVEITGGRGASEQVRQMRADLAELVFDGDLTGLEQLARAAVAEFGRLPTSGSWSQNAVLQALTPRTLLAGLMRTAEPADELAERVTRREFTARLARFEERVTADVRRRIAEDRGTERVVVRRPLNQRDFLSMGQADLIALRREVYPLSRRLATRMSRRNRRSRRGTLDFRRTIRRSLATGGVPVYPVRRPRRPHRPELVVLCDVSSSVAAFARFALLLVYALREQFTKVRAFAFVRQADEVTRYFADADDVLDALERMETEGGIQLMGGGTNYGRVFGDFAARYPDAVGPKTALLILGDARSNYADPAVDALAALADRARHAYWLNPEPQRNWDTGDSVAGRYAEVVEMVECRNLTQLAEFVRHLA